MPFKQYSLSCVCARTRVFMCDKRTCNVFLTNFRYLDETVAFAISTNNYKEQANIRWQNITKYYCNVERHRKKFYENA